MYILTPSGTLPVAHYLAEVCRGELEEPLAVGRGPRVSTDIETDPSCTARNSSPFSYTAGNSSPFQN